MGISGLLPLLKSIHKPCSLKKYAGETIGVDAYGWLHRGTAACAIELAQDKPTTKFVDFAMSRVRMLVHFGITPYIVFDGDYLPSKTGTEKDRAAKRKESKRLGLELLRAGKISQAHLELQKAVDVTPEMARLLIEELKHHNIQYVVAPFEADSQLVYLERKGIIDGILSEDSDMLVFGAKCLITKLDKYGECVEINRNLFTACREISLVGWTDADFRRMAILSGCDYLPGIGSMGLKTAYRMLRKHKNVERLIKAAQFDGKFKVPPGYLEAFIQAESTFLYQWVFCPLSNEVVNLTTPDAETDVTSMPFIGAEVPSHIAYGVARGDLHPHTKRPISVSSKATPRGKPLRPTRSISTPNYITAKQSAKPIDSFFKPRRTPLAELDINLFTPSPSQQTLLEQHRSSNGWEPDPVPQAMPQQLRTAPQPSRRAISDSVAVRQSAPNPPKRQRLCSDSNSDVSSPGKDVTRSRFFGASIAEPSPSLRNNRGRRKKPSQDFELHSDDSVEQALAEIVDLEEITTQPKKRMRIFSDHLISTHVSDSQSSTGSTVVTHVSQDSQVPRTCTPATSHGSPEPDTVFSASLPKQFGAFRSQFSYTSKDVISSRTKSSQAASVCPAGLVGTEKSFDVSNSTEEMSIEVASRKTLVRRKSIKDEADTGLIEDSAWATMESEIVVAASDTEPATSRRSTPAKQDEVKGSEELLIPDSDAESICSPRKPLLNLGRFAFIS